MRNIPRDSDEYKQLVRESADSVREMLSRRVYGQPYDTHVKEPLLALAVAVLYADLLIRTLADATGETPEEVLSGIMPQFSSFDFDPLTGGPLDP